MAYIVMAYMVMADIVMAVPCRCRRRAVAVSHPSRARPFAAVPCRVVPRRAVLRTVPAPWAVPCPVMPVPVRVPCALCAAVSRRAVPRMCPVPRAAPVCLFRVMPGADVRLRAYLVRAFV